VPFVGDRGFIVINSLAAFLLGVIQNFAIDTEFTISRSICPGLVVVLAVVVVVNNCCLCCCSFVVAFVSVIVEV
jgi:hypothetical protein